MENYNGTFRDTREANNQLFVYSVCCTSAMYSLRPNWLCVYIYIHNVCTLSMLPPPQKKERKKKHIYIYISQYW